MLEQKMIKEDFVEKYKFATPEAIEAAVERAN